MCKKTSAATRSHQRLLENNFKNELFSPATLGVTVLFEFVKDRITTMKGTVK
jgi:hypothetical protein